MAMVSRRSARRLVGLGLVVAGGILVVTLCSMRFGPASDADGWRRQAARGSVSHHRVSEELAEAGRIPWSPAKGSLPAVPPMSPPPKKGK